ncbi:BID domain-containing T4SS effector [Bartonella raoultii]|uniref:protein adenylyltransferase n=1 Tax=Bartonella raoultii TaxID=1457020 RepID=A0ABS7I3I9_9HYPH|nr:BID domain-containing T4SS effector [Bartonella raoultii]MBX4335233.1 BID domain-containing T4SS effector [Bartonella raoultii]
MLENNYLYKNGKALKNIYGIKDPKTLYERSAHEASKAAVNLRHEPPPQKFDANYLKQIHWSFFYKTFEWAGKTRDQSFTFLDGSTARMPAMRPKGYEIPFAIGQQIPKKLKQLEHSLTAKNNLKDLSRAEFAEQAAEVFLTLDNIHAFRKGNGRTNRMFLEKLGQAAGHRIDFSVITKERMVQSSVEAMQYGNSQPMKDLFEDATHPQKILLLKEFISQMKDAGLDKINEHVVVTAKEGTTYDGIFLGASAEGFVMQVKDGFVVGSKDDLKPEQVKTLQNGAHICFQKSNVQPITETLIPEETLAPLTHEELFERVASNPFVEESRKNVEACAKIVYGSRKTLSAKLDILTADPSLGQQFADEIHQNPHSVSKLAGGKMWNMKTPDRRQAEAHVTQLCEALKNYATAARQTREDVLDHHKKEQNRLKNSVEKPDKDLQTLFSLSAEQQREALSQSVPLQQKLHHFSRMLHNRLSSDNRTAIKENDHTRLAAMLGISESKAREISQVQKQTKEAQSQIRTLKTSRSSLLALTG